MSNKICPLMLLGEPSAIKENYICYGKDCGWYDIEDNGCALVSMSLSLTAIYKNIS